MARINIDEQFWRDVMKLAAKLGSVDLAIGQAVRFFDLAQQRYKKDRHIGESEFSREGFSESLFDIFAERVDGGIMAIGAAKQFGWLRGRVTSGQKGGVASGETRRRDFKDLEPSKRKQTQANASNSKQPEASPSLSPSFSLSHSPSNSPFLKGTKEKSSTKAAIAAYCEKFKIRWAYNPPIMGKDAGIVGRMMKTLTLESFSFYLDAYFTMPDTGVIKAKHPLNLFELKLNEVVVFAKSGQFTTQTQARQADGMATNEMLLRKVREENK